MVLSNSLIHHANTSVSRANTAQDCALWCLVKRFRHPSVMSHVLPHVSLNTSTRSLSLTSLIFRPFSPPLSGPLELDQETLRYSRRSGGSTKVCISHMVRVSDKKRCQYCLGSNGYLLYMRAFQGHCGRNKVAPSLQDDRGRGKDGTWNRFQNSRFFTCCSRRRRKLSDTFD